MNLKQRSLTICGVILLASACTSSSSPNSGTGGRADGAAGSGSGGAGGNTDVRADVPGGSPDVGGGSGGSGGSGGVDAPVTADTGAGTDTVRTDVAGEGATAACPFAFCETFEQTAAGMPPDPTKWALDGSPVTVDAVRPHAGSNSLHIAPHNGGLCTEGAASCPAARFIRLTSAFPQALHARFYGRVWFYINLLPTDNAYYHWMVMEAGAGTNYFGGMAVRQGGEIQNGAHYMMTHLETHMHQILPFEFPVRDTAATVTTRRWYCLEWFYDGPNNEARYWFDGVERPGLYYKGPMAGAPQFNFPAEFRSVAFGWRSFQVSQTPFEVFVDDIALDSQKIGCN